MEKLVKNEQNSLEAIYVSISEESSKKIAEENFTEFHERIFDKLNKNSRSALVCDLNLYKNFCVESSIPQFSFDFTLAKETIYQYIDHLVALEQSQSTFRRKLSSINKMYRILEIKNPLKDSEIIKEYVSLSVKDLKPAQQVYPIRHSAVKKLEEVTLDSSLKDIRDNMIFFLGIYTLCRASELLDLDVNNIDFQQETAYIKKAKNDQFGAGRFANLSPKTINLVRLYLEKSGIKSGKLIRAISSNGKIRSMIISKGVHKGKARDAMGYRGLLYIFKRAAPAIVSEFEVDQLFGTHSLRIGSAVSMAEKEVPLTEIALAGGWFSLRMPLQYTRQAEVKKIGTSKFVD